MSSTSESSATEYRRRLPEIPRAVKFSGDVLNRIDDVAEKIDHVGNRMRQVETLMADYQEVPVRVISNEKTELMRLRDEVNKTLNRFDGLSEPAGVSVVYPGAYERKLETECLKNSLEKLNQRMNQTEVERSLNRDELNRTKTELEQARMEAQRAREKEERARKLESDLRTTTERESHLTQHLNVVTERADSVSLRNQELQKELVNSQMDSTKLRNDCTQLVQEIEKLRIEQTEDKKHFADNERLTAQLGRQLAEQRTASEKIQVINAELNSKLGGCENQITKLNSKIEHFEHDKIETQNLLRSYKEENVNYAFDLSTAQKGLKATQSELENAKLREVSLRSELDSVRERNGELEMLKSKLTSTSEDSAHSIIKLESENKCLTARVKELERELSNTYSKLREGEELLNDNKGIIADIKNHNYELDSKIKHFEQVNLKNSTLKSAVDEELVHLKAANFEMKQNNQALNSELMVERKKRENAERELLKFEERYKSDQKTNNDQMARILNEMKLKEEQNNEAIEKMKVKNTNESKSFQDQLTEAKAENISLTDEVSHQNGKCSSLQQRLREAESELNSKTLENDELTEKVSAKDSAIEKMKNNGMVLENELLKSRQEMAHLDIILKRSCAIAKTNEDQLQELPILIERLQSSNDTFKTKTQQIALELEQMKMKNEKNAREYQTQRRSLVEELGAEKDRNLATRQKMTSLSAENEELKIQIKGLKEKFEILAQEIENSRIKSEIRALNR